MTTVNIEISDWIYTKLQSKNLNAYIVKLIEEDLLLKEIQESKKSGSFSLDSLDDLDA